MRKLTLKFISFLLAMLTAVSASAAPVFAADGNWKKDNDGWWYSYISGGYAKNSWEKIDGIWYHFDASGYMQTGWLKDGAHWYYLTPSGAMKTGWQYDGGFWYYLTGSGAMAVGWVSVGGKWYYMDTSGKMLSDTFLTLSDGIYYLGTDGAMAIGKTIVDGMEYTFDSNGRMVEYNVEEQQLSYELPDGWVNMFEDNGSSMLLREDILLTGEGSNILVLLIPLDELTEAEREEFRDVLDDPKAYAENEDVHHSMIEQLAEDYDIKAAGVVGRVNNNTAGDTAVTFLISLTAVQEQDSVEMLVSQTQVLLDNALIIVQLSAEENIFDTYEKDLDVILNSLKMK